MGIHPQRRTVNQDVNLLDSGTRSITPNGFRDLSVC